jgi:AraC-like DNA-binding protein
MCKPENCFLECAETTNISHFPDKPAPEIPPDINGLGAMFYHSYAPGPPLSELVDYFWLFAGGQAARKERIVPSGTIELVINLRHDDLRIHDPAQPERYERFSGAVTSGTYSRVFIVDAMQHESMFGVHFKPGGAFPLLGALASELTDSHADLADLWGRSALELRERLCAVSTPRDRFQVMEEVLTHRLRRSAKRHSAIPIALGAFGPAGTRASIRDVAREVGLCQRRFIQVFSAQVGLTPKLFCRLLRLQRARTLAEQIERLDWGQLASACGYFDQSHLIRDFQEFSGLTPTEYLRQHRQDGRLKSNHVPLRG